MKLSLMLEMPLAAYHVDPNVVGGKKPLRFTNGAGIFTKQSANALRKPKVQKKLSQVLSKSPYNIIIIADSEALAGESGDGVGPAGEIGLTDDYYIDAGIDPNIAKNAITIIISKDNADGQHNLTPWIILHQIGEIVNAGGLDDIWHNIFDKYKKYLSKTPMARGKPDNVGPYGGEAYKDSFTHIFKMKSAREFIHGGFDNFDTGAELVAEYLWHGGNIRVNYPDWLDKRIVDAIKKDAETEISRRLDTMIGGAYNNEL